MTGCLRIGHSDGEGVASDPEQKNPSSIKEENKAPSDAVIEINRWDTCSLLGNLHGVTKVKRLYEIITKAVAYK